MGQTHQLKADWITKTPQYVVYKDTHKTNKTVRFKIKGWKRHNRQNKRKLR